jgi:hypothetical protein
LKRFGRERRSPVNATSGADRAGRDVSSAITSRNASASRARRAARIRSVLHWRPSPGGPVPHRADRSGDTRSERTRHRERAAWNREAEPRNGYGQVAAPASVRARHPVPVDRTARTHSRGRSHAP